MIKKPWTKRSLPLVTSLSKYGQGLFAFDPTVSPYGVFTNDDLFKKLGLTVPQTFSQLLEVCQKAKAAGTVAVQLGGVGGNRGLEPAHGPGGRDRVRQGRTLGRRSESGNGELRRNDRLARRTAGVRRYV